MAVSGSQKTRIGASIAGVGKKEAFTAKAAGGVTTTVLDFGRGLARAMQRGLFR